MLKEYQKHYDVLNAQTGAPAPDEYWKGKQEKTKQRYLEINAFLGKKKDPLQGPVMDAAQMNPPTPEFHPGQLDFEDYQGCLLNPNMPENEPPLTPIPEDKELRLKKSPDAAKLEDDKTNITPVEKTGSTPTASKIFNRSKQAKNKGNKANSQPPQPNDVVLDEFYAHQNELFKKAEDRKDARQKA